MKGKYITDRLIAKREGLKIIGYNVRYWFICYSNTMCCCMCNNCRSCMANQTEQEMNDNAKIDRATAICLCVAFIILCVAMGAWTL
jgi:hypothetical protein